MQKCIHLHALDKIKPVIVVLTSAEKRKLFLQTEIFVPIYEMP